LSCWGGNHEWHGEVARRDDDGFAYWEFGIKFASNPLLKCALQSRTEPARERAINSSIEIAETIRWRDHGVCNTSIKEWTTHNLQPRQVSQ
jgi:hypothetical protein